MQMEQVRFDNSKLKAKEQEMMFRMAGICENDKDWTQLFDFLGLMTKWYRFPAYWFTYLCQLLTHTTKSPYHMYACWLYSDAQVNFNSDLAINSLEVAYNTILSNKDKFSIEYFTNAERTISLKLKSYHRFYQRFCKPFNYMECNPLVNNLYTQKTYDELCINFPELIEPSTEPKRENLLAIIDECQDLNSIYYRIEARKFLGLSYQGTNEKEAACEQFQLGLKESIQYRLESEIGHFYRLHGYALKTLHKFTEAEQQFVKAYKFEPSPNCSYWQALSAKELGDVRWQIAISPESIEAKGKIDEMPALEAYNSGRKLLDAHLGSQVLPLDRAITKQLFRSFSDNAIVAASYQQNLETLLSEIESNSPHSVTEIMAEVIAAEDLPDELRKDFTKSREIFHHHLNSIPEKFEDYLSSLPEEYQSRRLYTRARVALTNKITHSRMSDESVNKLLSLRFPDVIFLFFNVGWMQVTAVFVDMATGTMIHSFIGLHDFESIHNDYNQSLNEAKSLPDPGPLTRKALNKLLEGYQKLFASTFEELLPLIKNRHLKIFPRMQMTDVPFHALLVGGKRLIEHCYVSYGISIGEFLTYQNNNGEQNTKGLLTVYDDVGAPLYKAICDNKNESHLTESVTLRNPNWEDLLNTIEQYQPQDLFFACHGNYYPDNPSSSCLWLSEDKKITLSSLFSQLKLENRRSVILGACESGLARSEITEEYIGLSAIFLAAGVKYVIGSLWKVNQLATVILLSQYFSFLNDEKQKVPFSLNLAQRCLLSMTRESVKNWVKINLPELEALLCPKIDKMGEKPFNHPDYWAGFYVLGDV